MSSKRGALKAITGGVSAAAEQTARAFEKATERRGRMLREVELASLRPDPNNPRTATNDEALAELAKSIADRGVLQPLIVRPTQTDGTFMIVAGHRRYLAACEAGIAQTALRP